MKEEFISYLKCFIGSRYQWGAEGPYNVGFDCSGFVQEGLRAFGLTDRTDNSAQSFYELFKNNPSPDRADLGDVIFFGKDKKSITHIGVMINNWQFIEAGGGDSKTVDKGMVRIRPLKSRRDHVATLSIFKE